jgi:hypothetical protein
VCNNDHGHHHHHHATITTTTVPSPPSHCLLLKNKMGKLGDQKPMASDVGVTDPKEGIK